MPSVVNRKKNNPPPTPYRILALSVLLASQIFFGGIKERKFLLFRRKVYVNLSKVSLPLSSPLTNCSPSKDFLSRGKNIKLSVEPRNQALTGLGFI